jgi:hypothetical protein
MPFDSARRHISKNGENRKVIFGTFCQKKMKKSKKMSVCFYSFIIGAFSKIQSQCENISQKNARAFTRDCAAAFVHFPCEEAQSRARNQTSGRCSPLRRACEARILAAWRQVARGIFLEPFGTISER